MSFGAFSAPSVGAATADEVVQIAELLARAFCDNPLSVAVIGSEKPGRRLRASRPGIRSLVDVARAHGEVWAARDGATPRGALVACPPGRHPFPPSPLAQRLRTLWVQGWRVARRWAEVFEALQHHHPVEKHWYLGTLGVDPLAQGRGIGTQLLRRWLGRVDEAGGRVYLETDRERNVGWYEREGFSVVATFPVQGVPVWCMQRPSADGPLGRSAPRP